MQTRNDKVRNWGGEPDAGGRLWLVLKESFQWSARAPSIAATSRCHLYGCLRYFQTALEEEQEEDGSVTVGSLCAAWDKVKNDMNTVCVHLRLFSEPIMRINPPPPPHPPPPHPPPP